MVNSRVEIMKSFFDEDEKILWSKILGEKGSNERIYIITNKRCYKKSHKIAEIDYSGAPKEYLKVIDDILIIERRGIQHIKFSHWVSCILKGEQTQRKPYFSFSGIRRTEGEMIKNMLLDTHNLAQISSSGSGDVSSQYSQFAQPVNPEEQYLTPSFTGPEGGANSAQIVEVAGGTGTCAYCNIAISEIQGKVYGCTSCGVLYHEACLNNVMREGWCSNCNKILLW